MAKPARRRDSTSRRERSPDLWSSPTPPRPPGRGGLRPGMTFPAAAPLTRASVAREAWPLILANAAVPALGLVDTAVIGHFGTATDLGGLALGALLFNFVYWSFGFLRMGTTGF